MSEALSIDRSLDRVPNHPSHSRSVCEIRAQALLLRGHGIRLHCRPLSRAQQLSQTEAYGRRISHAKGHRAIRHLREPPEPLCRRGPRRNLQHLAPLLRPVLLCRAPIDRGILYPHLGQLGVGTLNVLTGCLLTGVGTSTSTPRPDGRSLVTRSKDEMGLWMDRDGAVCVYYFDRRGESQLLPTSIFACFFSTYEA